MANDTGAMLVRAGLIDQADLDTLRKESQTEDGTVAERLVYAGVLDDDALTSFYCDQLLVPRISDRECTQIAREVVSRLPKDMAAELRAVPVSVDRDNYITVLMSDPGDSQAIDEIVFHTGAYVIRAVTTQSQLAWCLNKYYGIETQLFKRGRKSDLKVERQESGRAVTVDEEVEIAADREVNQTMSGTIELGKGPGRPVDPSSVEIAPSLAAKGASKASPATDTPVRRRSDTAAEPKSVAASGTISSGTISGDVPQKIANTARSERHVSESIPIALSDEATPAPPAGYDSFGKDMDLNSDASVLLLSTLRTIERAEERDHVLAALVDHFSQIYLLVVFFALRKDELHAWTTSLQGIRKSTTGVLDMSVDSTFKDVLSTRLPFQGAIRDEASQALFKATVGMVPDHTLLVPLTLNGRSIGVLAAASPMDKPSNEHISVVLRSASDALKRIVLAQKKAPV